MNRNPLADHLMIQLRTARKAAGLSQPELARRMDVDQSAVSIIERGQRVPRLATLAAWAAATGCALRIDLVPLASEGIEPNADILDAYRRLAPADARAVLAMARHLVERS